MLMLDADSVPVAGLPSDEDYVRVMRIASTSLLRAVERAQGKYLAPPPPPTPPKIPRPPASIPGEMLGKSIIRAVASAYCLQPCELLRRNRNKEMVAARSVVARLLHEQKWADGAPRFSSCQIARMMAGRDHSTILHSLKQFDAYCAEFPFARSTYDALRGAA